ncbi:hypothetical protein [Flavivirga eckloniae]
MNHKNKMVIEPLYHGISKLSDSLCWIKKTP